MPCEKHEWIFETACPYCSPAEGGSKAVGPIGDIIEHVDPNAEDPEVSAARRKAEYARDELTATVTTEE